jgi:hypothetical protein
MRNTRNSRSKRPKLQISHVRPPAFNAYYPLRHKFRFQYSPTSSSNLVTTVVSSITVGQILGSAGVLCTALNSTAYNWFTGFKLHSVEIWGAYNPNNASGIAGNYTPAFVQVDWAKSTLAIEAPVLITDSSADSAHPAHVKSAPPKSTQASFWNDNASGSSVICILVYNCPVTVDIDLTLGSGDSSATSYAISAGVVGDQYSLPLDGVSTHNLLAVGLPSTF